MGNPTNRIEIKKGDDGTVSVGFVDLSPEELAAQTTPPEQTDHDSLRLELTEGGKADPQLRAMASEVAIHGFKETMHRWGE